MELVILILAAIGPFESQEQLILTVAMITMVVLGLALIYGGVHAFRLMVAILRNRPVDAGEVGTIDDGIVEVQSTAQPLDATTNGELSHDGSPLLKQWRKVRIVERHGNDNRDARNKTRTIDRERHTEPFRLEDETGSVVVDPRGATLSLRERRITGGGRIQEYQADVKPGDSVHIFGEKRTGSPSDGSAELDHVVGDGTSVPDFVISDTAQFRTMFRKARKSIGMLVLGIVLVVIGGAVLVVEGAASLGL